ncbi:phosphate propanoyltransferase [Enterococcus faecalis]|nr:phosphate propanoyltransferase [Enterococcus faecalis]NSM30022.1 phosphate propanoyltransferase [Enterococcus faecalis]
MNKLDSMNEIVEEVVKRIQQQQQNTFEVEASGRHVHLSRQEIDALFGPGYQLTKVKDLSQPGQFVCKERITVAGPKGLFQNVVILGPERSESQVEVSMTDTRILGINAPVRESGKTEGTPGVTLMNGSTVVTLSHGLIVAKRHIHMTPEDALKNKVSNSQIVQVKVEGTRPLIFDDVVVRISPRFATYMHIDYDEANACGLTKGARGYILK